MLIAVHPLNPDKRQIKKICDCLDKGGIIIYPTDTVYGIGCDLNYLPAIEKICKLKNTTPKKAKLSIICGSLSDISNYTKPFKTSVFRLLKSYLPGPFTFILPANKKIPELLHSPQKTIGIRIPNHTICLDIVNTLQRPILTSSLPINENNLYPYLPEEIYDNYNKVVNMVIDGGAGGVNLSTIIDCTTEPPEIVRQGIGIIEL